MQLHQTVQTMAEAVSAAVVLGVLGKVLPVLAILLSVTWYSINIWESRTGRGWRARWRRLFVKLFTRGSNAGWRQLDPEEWALILFLGMGGPGVFLMLYAIMDTWQ